jgi:hypothetical protein
VGGGGLVGELEGAGRLGDAIGDGPGELLHTVVRQPHPRIVVRLEIGIDDDTREKRLVVAARYQASPTMAALASVIVHVVCKKLSLTQILCFLNGLYDCRALHRHRGKRWCVRIAIQ